jgi:site-specific recombinase XerD
VALRDAEAAFAITTIGAAAEVEALPHVLRYTFATQLLREAEAGLVTVVELLRYSSVNTRRCTLSRVRRTRNRLSIG